MMGTPGNTIVGIAALWPDGWLYTMLGCKRTSCQCENLKLLVILEIDDDQLCIEFEKNLVVVKEHFLAQKN
jgi:hypothetical protein